MAERSNHEFQHTAARRRLADSSASQLRSCRFQHTAARRRLRYTRFPDGAWYGFNTQPPEGGWRRWQRRLDALCRFNTQPPEGGCTGNGFKATASKVSFQHTAARRRLAIQSSLVRHSIIGVVSTHSRPKAAAGLAQTRVARAIVSTHSRPKAAARRAAIAFGDASFQHTAARRRLVSNSQYWQA